MKEETLRFGRLAQTFAHCELPLEVLQSRAGYYIGTFHPVDGPFSRESAEYFPTAQAAREALERGAWTQRSSP
jgi:hypothetical protein